MRIVEQVFPGYQWAEPLQGKDLEVIEVASGLQITGVFPLYRYEGSASDFVWQFRKSPKSRPIGQQGGGKLSPDMRFANADSDAKRLAFVRTFGPVVAESVNDVLFTPDEKSDDPQPLLKLVAHQNLDELRGEHTIYRAAVNLMFLLGNKPFNYEAAQTSIAEISTHIPHWPEQWKRELAHRRSEPFWKPRAESIKRITQLASSGNTVGHFPDLAARIVICELLNCFRSTVFPNAIEMHSSIKYGIRPLLYSVLRRQFLAPRDFAACANTHCRDFFNLDRTGQRYCSADCSLKQRQRDYWKKRGKRLRLKRSTAKGVVKR